MTFRANAEMSGKSTPGHQAKNSCKNRNGYTFYPWGHRKRVNTVAETLFPFKETKFRQQCLLVTCFLITCFVWAQTGKHLKMFPRLRSHETCDEETFLFPKNKDLLNIFFFLETVCFRNKCFSVWAPRKQCWQDSRIARAALSKLSMRKMFGSNRSNLGCACSRSKASKSFRPWKAIRKNMNHLFHKAVILARLYNKKCLTYNKVSCLVTSLFNRYSVRNQPEKLRGFWETYA